MEWSRQERIFDLNNYMYFNHANLRVIEPCCEPQHRSLFAKILSFSCLSQWRSGQTSEACNSEQCHENVNFEIFVSAFYCQRSSVTEKREPLYRYVNLGTASLLCTIEKGREHMAKTNPE